MGNKTSNKGMLERLRGVVKGGVIALSAIALSGALALIVHDATYDAETQMTALEQSGWGNEVFDAIHDTGLIQGVIKPANACGLGASSCFRCHNGRRAPEPAADQATAPWHVDHARVNNSCAGCHNGNPRLMREEMAHKDMLADPRNTPAESCASCHRDASELEGLLDRYLKVGS
jgi:hypothetical protein